MLMTALHGLTDDELTARLTALNGSEREATAALVAHLAELESRDLHLAMGFKSLYGYCRAVLHLSEHESYNRMEAAHAVRRFPLIVPMLADGLLHLTAVRLLAPHLGDENHLALLGSAIHKSKFEVKQLLARWFPKADVRTSIRRIPPPAATKPEDGALPRVRGGESPLFADTGESAAESRGNENATSDHPTHGGGGAASGTVVARAAGSANEEPPAAKPGEPGPPRPVHQRAVRAKAVIDPLSADTYAMRVTARAATIERLRRAQEILSHAVPDGDVDEILYRALGALETEGRKKLAVARPRSARDGRGAARAADGASRTAEPASRTITADVQRAVRQRDGDRCAFVSKDGRRCEERRFLELHHLKPWIAGGGRTARNISLRCHAHNQYEWKAYVAPIRAAQEMTVTGSGTS